MATGFPPCDDNCVNFKPTRTPHERCPCSETGLKDLAWHDLRDTGAGSCGYELAGFEFSPARFFS